MIVHISSTSHLVEKRNQIRVYFAALAINIYIYIYSILFADVIHRFFSMYKSAGYVSAVEFCRSFINSIDEYDFHRII